MLLVKKVFAVGILCFVLLLGLHLIIHNRVVAKNLLRNTSPFATKIVDAEDVSTSGGRYLLTRGMLYVVGVVFVGCALLATAKQFFAK